MKTICFAIAILLIVVCGLNVLPGFACTDFQVKTTQGTVVIGRSMEWGADLHSRLVVHPKQENNMAKAPDGKQGLVWTSKYGYVGIDANSLDTALDGMNEAGLSLGLLWLPGYTQYQDVPTGENNTALDITNLGAWILGNFATVDEVKIAIGKVHVWASAIPSFGGIPTAHIAIHDRTGKNMVIEFVAGQQKIYDNPCGVMTNAPTFDWHLINLNNYLMIRATNPEPVKIAGTILSPPGQGSGFLGIPGDWTPPSRFVRTAAMLAFAQRAKIAEEGVNLTEHILNAVDIPRGALRDKVAGIECADYTQWIVIKDLTNRIFYFRSYENMTLRSLDLNKLNLSPRQPRHYFGIAGGALAQDITNELN